MREIKFRAWIRTCEESKSYMAEWNQEWLDDDRDGDILWIHQLIPNKDIGDTEKIIPMQYTGLKDKNGKEIYEGDVVKDNKGNITTVEWDDEIDTDRYWWIASGFSIYFREHGAGSCGTLEVIGNIYENPELSNTVDAGKG